MITSVVGTAHILNEKFPLVFSDTGGNIWAVNIQMNWVDGKYLVEIYAYSDSGAISFWLGWLYISNGACVKLEFIRKQFEFTPIETLEINETGREFNFSAMDRDFEINIANPDIIFLPMGKGCIHAK